MTPDSAFQHPLTTRRAFLAGAGAAGLGLGLAACGGSDGDAPARKASTAGGDFPASVVHKYGGEEFVVLLPETDGAEAMATADKLRGVLARAPVIAGTTSISIRASIGVAAWGAGMRTPSDLYAAADEALYRAKDLGRDRTELYVARTARP